LHLLKAVTSKFTGVASKQNATLDEETLKYLHDWQLRLCINFWNIYCGATLPIYAGLAILTRYWGPLPLQTTFGVVWSALSLISAAGIILSGFLKKHPSLALIQSIWAVAIVVPIMGFACLNIKFLGSESIGKEYGFGMGFINGIHAIMICGAAIFLGRSVIIFNIIHAAIGTGIWLTVNPTGTIETVILLLASDMFLIFYSQTIAVHTRNAALATYRSRKLEQENQGLKLRSIEQELFVAQEIQAAFSPLPETLQCGRYQLRCFYQPFGLLGGDFMAVRTMPGDKIVTVVGDVSGKGIPAAMVVQSVQSLWVESLQSTEFDPIEWLNSLNETLLIMGKKQPYSLTMGILVLENSKISYFSAGHVPLICLQSDAGQIKIRQLTGGGSPLGLLPSLHIKPVIQSLEPNDQLRLLFGSDGILPREVRSKRRTLLALSEALQTKGKEALSDFGDADDKIIVIVDCDATGKKDSQ
jgi:hypothetical protein